MANVAGQKVEDNVTNAKSGAALEGWGQIKAVRADPVTRDVGGKAGNEKALVEMREETKSPTIVLPKKSCYF